MVSFILFPNLALQYPSNQRRLLVELRRHLHRQQQPKLGRNLDLCNHAKAQSKHRLGFASRDPILKQLVPKVFHMGSTALFPLISNLRFSFFALHLLFQHFLELKDVRVFAVTATDSGPHGS
jgi:hypothetical protein